MTCHRVLALLSLLVALGCQSGTEEPDPTPGDGGVRVELGEQVICADPMPDDVPVAYTQVVDSSTIGYSAATPLWDGTQNGYSSVDIEAAGGIAVADLDGNGTLDVLITDHNADPRLFLGNGNGGFEQVSAPERGIESHGAYLIGASAVDINGDNLADLYLLANGANLLFINDGTGNFSEHSQEYGLAGEQRRSLSAAWADVDRDHDLDVLVVNHGPGRFLHGGEPPADEDQLFLRDGEVFHDRIDLVYPDLRLDGYGFAAGWFDADGDGLLDLYVVNDLATVGGDKPPNFFAQNLGPDDNGDPILVVPPQSHLDLPMLAMGLAVGDLDGDADLDLHISNANRTYLARNDGELLFTDLSLLLAGHSAGPLGDISWSTEFFDQDNDGRLELFCAFGHMPTKVGDGPNNTANPQDQYDALWQIQDDPEAVDNIATEVGIDSPRSTRTMVAADFDRNGFLDLVTWALYDGPSLYLAGCNSRAWLIVQLDLPGTLNRNGIGARIEAWAGEELVAMREMVAGSTGAMSSGPPEVHLGLDSHESVELRVRWPDGQQTVHPDIATRREVRLVHLEGT